MKLNLHHLGKAVQDIKKEYDFYQNFGFEIVAGFEEPKLDREQKVIVGAVKLGDFLIELLEPASSDSPIANFQKKGGGFYHICYEVEDLDKAITEIREKSLAHQISKATISVWEKRPVVFFIDKNYSIFELISE